MGCRLIKVPRLLTWHAAAISIVFVVLSLHAAAPVPGLNEAAASNQDIYAELALKQTNGPSYEFFRDLIPPLHYVNADFRHYPIVLSAPRAPLKARLVSNGSGINLRANTSAWRDTGIPVLFRVGNDELAFGEYARRLHGPALLEGFLPVVQLSYEHGGGTYSQQTFASVTPEYLTKAVVLTHFEFSSKSTERPSGKVTVRIDAPGLNSQQHCILDSNNNVLAWHDGNWKWDTNRKVLEVRFNATGSAAIAVASIPAPQTFRSPLVENGYTRELESCVAAWKGLLAQGMNIFVPEPYVQNAWRTLLLANFSLINGDRIHYSAGNQYEKIYEHEGSQAAQALMQYGYEDEMRRLIVPLLDFTRKGLEFHQAGHKLDNLCRYYWQTRDAQTVRELRPKWQRELDRLTNRRSAENGLYPREQYCGDITNAVFSMNSNAKGWRALSDTASLLEALGDAAEAQRLRRVSVDFRESILAGLDKSLTFRSDPPFVPIALMGEEQPYDFITATKMGSYWNLMANSVLGTEIFGQQHELEIGMLRYFQKHGGLFMGLTRSRPWPSFWVSGANMNPLYGWPYVRTLLRRDEPERALVSFYGMLAAGLTPNTFTCGEGCSIQPVDDLGRQFYLPPNSAGNAFCLLTLRSLLVQDLDVDENGKPETLRLLFATPRRWLENGKTIKVQNAPTAFGRVSFQVQSRISAGEIVANLELPSRNPATRTLLRMRVPEGYKVESARAGGVKLDTDKMGTIDITLLAGHQTLVCRISRD